MNSLNTLSQPIALTTTGPDRHRSRSRHATHKDPVLYLAGLVLLLAARYFCSRADAKQLRWILAPTAWLVQTFGHIPFSWEARLGYVSHAYRFILAPSCSGLQFMLIGAATLFFSFLHRMETKKEKLGWTMSSLMISYLFTLSVNSLRVILSVHLPLLLEETGIFRTWLTKERFHTAIGVLVYFPALLLLYQTAHACLDTRRPESPMASLPGTGLPKRPRQGRTAASFIKQVRRYVPPVFWYVSMVLGIPLLSQLRQSTGNAFWSYALLVTVLCLLILLLFGLILCVKRCYLPPGADIAGNGDDISPNGASQDHRDPPV